MFAALSKLRPVQDIDKVLTKAWSVRFLILATVLDAAQTGVSFFSGSELVRPGTLAALNMVLALAALGARLIAQEAVSGPAPSTTPGDA
ncbi:hypothetical protein A3862_04240 [Methylobacterium sp. XJLW]|uniref:DUF7940 domain-containing protein n=1 Tax=Methylobacterium sp. XJLW TaxID=739141 RepID=UPI000DAAFCAD|nr:hypothetical protein [Methylobacterium sp. XJLW]AWV14808.1 hypothetical protein A3862_04240 [Methylobacterium sp. XJLW]